MKQSGIGLLLLKKKWEQGDYIKWHYDVEAEAEDADFTQHTSCFFGSLNGCLPSCASTVKRSIRDKVQLKSRDLIRHGQRTKLLGAFCNFVPAILCLILPVGIFPYWELQYKAFICWLLYLVFTGRFVLLYCTVREPEPDCLCVFLLGLSGPLILPLPLEKTIHNVKVSVILSHKALEMGACCINERHYGKLTAQSAHPKVYLRKLLCSNTPHIGGHHKKNSIFKIKKLNAPICLCSWKHYHRYKYVKCTRIKACSGYLLKRFLLFRY